jgi:nucleoside-diphosphate-sugar epimerase
MATTFLILGGNGFLGASIRNQFKENNINLYLYNRENDTIINNTGDQVFSFKEFLVNEESFSIMNLLAAWGDIDQKIIKYANYDLPLSIFNRVISTHKKTLWIQVSSYFNFYYLETGIDKDSYSYWKRMFSDKLKNELLTNASKLSSLELFLPHLYGKNDKNSRLISLLTEKRVNSQPINISSGLQYLPILHVDDCAKGVFEIVAKKKSLFHDSQVYIKEQSQFKVEQIVKIIQKFNKITVNFNALLDRQNEFYFPIISQLNEYYIEHMTTLDEYLESIYN